MRIATFNLENLDDKPKAAPSLEDRIAVLRPQIERLDADILCLQEVNAQRLSEKEERGPWALNRLLAGTGYAQFSWAASGLPNSKHLADVHNIVVLSRWPIVDRQVLFHDLVEPLSPVQQTLQARPNGSSSVKWDRPALRTTIETPGGIVLHLFAVHLRAPLASPVSGEKLGPFKWRSVGGWAEGYFHAAMKRCAQAFEVRLAVEQLFDRHTEAQIMVCGDCNAEMMNTPLRILCADPEDTGNPQLADRTLRSLDDRIESAKRYTVLHGGRKLMLDHILCSSGLLARFEQIEVHNEDLEDEVCHENFKTGPLGSFHAPLVTQFTDHKNR